MDENSKRFILTIGAAFLITVIITSTYIIVWEKSGLPDIPELPPIEIPITFEKTEDINLYMNESDVEENLSLYTEGDVIYLNTSNKDSWVTPHGINHTDYVVVVGGAGGGAGYTSNTTSYTWTNATYTYSGGGGAGGIYTVYYNTTGV